MILSAAWFCILMTVSSYAAFACGRWDRSGLGGIAFVCAFLAFVVGADFTIFPLWEVVDRLLPEHGTGLHLFTALLITGLIILGGVAAWQVVMIRFGESLAGHGRDTSAHRGEAE